MTEYLRLTDDVLLQTPVRYYTHRVTGRRITVVATMRGGEPRYFRRLRAIIDELAAAGAVVQCEDARLLPGGEPDVTAEEQALLTDLGSVEQELEKRWFSGLGWIGRVDGLGYPSQWKIVDLSTLQVIRRTGIDAMRTYLAERARLVGKAPADGDIASFRLATTVAMRDLAGGGDPSDPADPFEALQSHRVDRAMYGVDATKRDAVLVWRSRYPQDLDAGLIRRGFAHGGDAGQWHTVAVLPSIAAAVAAAIRAEQMAQETRR